MGEPLLLCAASSLLRTPVRTPVSTHARTWMKSSEYGAASLQRPSTTWPRRPPRGNGRDATSSSCVSVSRAPSSFCTTESMSSGLPPRWCCVEGGGGGTKEGGRPVTVMEGAAARRPGRGGVGTRGMEEDTDASPSAGAGEGEGAAGPSASEHREPLLPLRPLTLTPSACSCRHCCAATCASCASCASRSSRCAEASISWCEGDAPSERLVPQLSVCSWLKGRTVWLRARRGSCCGSCCSCGGRGGGLPPAGGTSCCCCCCSCSCCGLTVPTDADLGRPLLPPPPPISDPTRPPMLLARVGGPTAVGRSRCLRCKASVRGGGKSEGRRSTMGTSVRVEAMSMPSQWEWCSASSASRTVCTPGTEGSRRVWLVEGGWWQQQIYVVVTWGDEVDEHARGALGAEAEEAVRVEEEDAAQLHGHGQDAEPPVEVCGWGRGQGGQGGVVSRSVDGWEEQLCQLCPTLPHSVMHATKTPRRVVVVVTHSAPRLRSCGPPAGSPARRRRGTALVVVVMSWLP